MAALGFVALVVAVLMVGGALAVGLVVLGNRNKEPRP